MAVDTDVLRRAVAHLLSAGHFYVRQHRNMGPNLEPAEVLELLHEEMESLVPAYRAGLQGALVPPHRIPVADSPGEHVIAVAVFRGKLLYWSDFEEGWEIEALDGSGGIPTRGSN